MKKHHWVIVFDEQNKWHIEPEIEEEVFNDGTIYDTDTHSWKSGYEGDGVYDEEDMKLTSQLMVELDKLNKVSA
jgi:hypothetical protein